MPERGCEIWSRVGDFVKGDFRISLNAGRNDCIKKEKMIPEKENITAGAKSLRRKKGWDPCMSVELGFERNRTIHPL